MRFSFAMLLVMMLVAGSARAQAAEAPVQTGGSTLPSVRAARMSDTHAFEGTASRSRPPVSWLRHTAKAPRFGWQARLVPAPAADLRYPGRGRVFRVRLQPEIVFDFSDSAIHLRGHGLHYSSHRSRPWSLDLNYRHMDLLPDTEIRLNDRSPRPKAVSVEWHLPFD